MVGGCKVVEPRRVKPISVRPDGIIGRYVDGADYADGCRAELPSGTSVTRPPTTAGYAAWSNVKAADTVQALR